MQSIKDRDELVCQHMELAEKMAKRRYQRVPRTVQLDDLLSAAYEGLIDAASKYNEERVNEDNEDKFVRYARCRIRGSMQDYLRSCNWGTRNNPQHLMSIDSESYSYNGWSNDRTPTVSEIFSYDDQSVIDKVNSDESFNKIIRCLPRREKRVFQLRYLYDLTMKEVAENVGITESRVSQILSTNVEYLKDVWRQRMDELLIEATPC